MLSPPPHPQPNIVSAMTHLRDAWQNPIVAGYPFIKMHHIDLGDDGGGLGTHCLGC